MVENTMAGPHTETAPAHRRQAPTTRAYQRRGREDVRILHYYVEACLGRGLVSPAVSEQIPRVLADQPVRRVGAMCPLFRLQPSSVL